MKQPLIIIAGPTAVGKTALSVALTKRIGGEIVSADSMQVYRGMDIGTAKVTKEETCGVPHHLIDVLDPKDPFNVMTFRSMVKDAVRGIASRGNVPVLVGGTGCGKSWSRKLLSWVRRKCTSASGHWTRMPRKPFIRTILKE